MSTPTVDTNGSIELRLERLKDFSHQEILRSWEKESRELVIEFIEKGLAAELETILGKKGRHLKERVNYFNGSYRRSFTSVEWGHLSDLKIPRPRKAVGQSYRFFQAYQRRSEEFDRFVLESYFLGHSTQKASRFFEGFFKELGLSASSVTSILAKFNGLVDTFRRKPINKPYRFLWLDAIWIDVKEGLLCDKTILFAMGLNTQGRLEILDFQVARSEAEVHWTRFLQNLVLRGLNPQTVACLVHDGAQAIENAALFVFPKAKSQSCLFHHLMNLTSNVRSRRLRRLILADAQAIFEAQGPQKLNRAIARFKSRWQAAEPRAVRLFLRSLDKSLVYREFEPELWHLLGTTNPLERFFEEIRRRQRPLRYFQSQAACERFLAWFCLEYNGELEESLLGSNYTRFN